MAASSPAKTSTTAISGAAASPSSAAALSVSNASKSLRGLNKPKCIKCGNVARSRCPYQSCKNCCAKAQNPCHIHVLKGSSSLPDKVPTSSSPLFDQQSTETSHTGNTHRLRQLSNNFAQFNNLQTPFRSRKPLTRKDAQVINEWRFVKLKEFREGRIEAEREAFDRYMQNASLLEEVFAVNSMDAEQIQDEKSSVMKYSSDGENDERMVNSLKRKLRSNPVRTDNLRKRIQHIVDQGLKKLGKFEVIDGAGDPVDTDDLGRMAKKIKSWDSEKASALSNLYDKLNKARNEDDLKECSESASEIFGWNTKMRHMEPDHVSISAEINSKDDPSTDQKSTHPPLKWVTTTTISDEALARLDAQFSSLEDIASF